MNHCPVKHEARLRLWTTALAVVLLAFCVLPPRVLAAQDSQDTGWARPASITVVLDDNYPPYIFRDEEGQVRGLLVDQWAAWEVATGVRVNLAAMDWERAKQVMRQGQADVIDTIFYNAERAKSYDFTQPYARLDVPVYFHKSLGGISDARSLRGFTVGVKAGDAVIDVLAQNGIHSLHEYGSYRDIIDAARAGDLRVFSMDAPPALYYLYKFQLESEFRQGFVLYSGAFHRAVKKGDARLLALVEQGFAAIPAGERAAIEERWLGAAIPGGHDMRLVFTVLGGIAALALALAFLSLVLRRRVRAKVAELSATLGELRTSEERFRSIFNSVSDLIFIHAWPDGRIVDVNQRACEVYGYTREEMLSLAVEITSAGYAPYDQAHAMDLMRQAYAGAPQVAEWLARRRDGGLFWIEVSIRRALVLGREHILVSCRDIDERKKTAEALARKDALLQAMLRNLPFDFWARNQDQRIIMQSDESVRLWGDLAAGPAAEAQIDPELRAAWEAANSRVLAGEVVSGEREYSMLNGERRVFHDIVAPIRDGDAVLGILGVNIDITERKLSEQALRESEERYRTLFEQSLDAIAIQEGLPPVFTWVNPAFCKLLGYSPEEIYALSTEDIWRLVHPEDRDLVRTSLTDRMAGRQDTAHYGFRIIRKDGAVRWVDVTGRRMQQGGRPMNLSIYRDTTEHKMYEEALTQARDAADAANRAKSEFLANMSHEIRTPLNGIVGMLQLLDGSPLDGEQQGFARAAIQSSQRLTSLLGDILDLSRIEARKLVLERKPFALAEILGSVEALYRLPAGQKGLGLHLRLDPDLPKWLLGDEHRLRQVLSNLVGNAVKFTPSGEILVEVEGLGPPSAQQRRVLFVVSDTGVGIPLGMLDQTFQMFTQVEGPLTRSHQGAGLGLAIVRHLVALLGGPGIDVSSEVGQGTTFSFALPFGLPEPGSIAESAPDETRDLAGLPSLEGLRVLLVEDEEINQLALRTGLERRGLLVTCAGSGEAALDALRQARFDCVLMDIQMPGMNGLEATQAIRTRPEFRDRADIPVIALTAFAMAGDRERFLAAGMDDYLAKPFSFDDLARILGRIRSERPARPDTRG